jgi:UDP-N-acetylglucosamine transferase subunit ALG13
MGRLLVLVPRLARLREHVDDHQMEIAMHLKQSCGVPIVADGVQLENAIRNARPVSFPKRDEQLPRRIAEYIGGLERHER